jgi:hypothetical protein
MATRTCDLTFDTLTVEQDGRVVTLRICAPPYNFMTAQMQKELDTFTAVVDDDPTVGAVIVTGGVPGRYITHFRHWGNPCRRGAQRTAAIAKGGAEPHARH